MSPTYQATSISQLAVYQMCENLDNNYSYIVKIIRDIYPELYLESPNYDWERKSILGCFHKNFSKLMKELNKAEIEIEKEKPFQWSTWKELADKEVIVIDLTHRFLTKWKIYKLYKKNDGNCIEVLNIIKEKYPHFYIPKDCTNNHLHRMISHCYVKMKKIIDSGCKEKLKHEKKNPFTWESKKIKRNSTVSSVKCPPVTELYHNHPTLGDIYQLCQEKKHRYVDIVKIIQDRYPDLCLPRRPTPYKLQLQVSKADKKIKSLLKKGSGELNAEKKKLFTWCNEASGSEQQTTVFPTDNFEEEKPSVRVETTDEDSSKTPSNFEPVDNHYLSTSSSSASHLNVNLSSLPVPQLQTLSPPRTPVSAIDLPQEAEALPSTIENKPGVISELPLETASPAASPSPMKNELDIAEDFTLETAAVSPLPMENVTNDLPLVKTSAVSPSHMDSDVNIDLPLETTSVSPSPMENEPAVTNNYPLEMAAASPSPMEYDSDETIDIPLETTSVSPSPMENEPAVTNNYPLETAAASPSPMENDSDETIDIPLETAPVSPSPMFNEPNVTNDLALTTTVAETGSLASHLENGPGVTNDSEHENLKITIKRFERLIEEAIEEIAAKDAKIESLKNDISNAMKNEKKLTSNLKRLQFQHLRRKIST